MGDLLMTFFEILHGTQDDPIYRDQIYRQSSAALLLATLAGTFLFYHVVGRVSARFILWTHWFTCMAITVLFAASVMVVMTHLQTGLWDFVLGIVLMLYGALFFICMSALMKMGSPNARRTPW